MDEGPIPAIHGVVRWRACDLIMRLHDAEAICEAVTRANMRFVETKTPEQIA